ncbi:guanine nucleotide-binding protein-like 3 [Scleropages formosus]|uniref:guanine nucleotide-binding protein-like 3 n=1 Tax=Scleropages formosus TaxID=113540 RepID=UPI0008785FBE|nr:guanine nucleotide-binding protein-like 3 [Scleropages formosus]
MKRPKLKKASKRLTCAKRYKIQRKIREHNRKLRKEAKKKGVTKRVKKDPGVPNDAPFKEDVLREAEQRRIQLEELKEKKKLEKKKERAEKCKKNSESNKEPQAKKARKEESAVSKDKYSGKFLCSELNKVINASEVIIEVLDARDPLGCRCPQLEEAVLKHEGNKKLLMVLNKIDCAPKENVKKWLNYLQREFPTVAFKASTHLQDKTAQDKKRKEPNRTLGLISEAPSFRGSCLLELLQDYARKRQTEGPLRVGVVGFPNVGKSSVINSLKGSRVCNAGVLRGVTKCMQEVHIAKNIKVIDSPGILASPSNPGVALALRSLPSTHKQDDVLDAVRDLLKHCNNQQVMLQYNVPAFKNSLEFLTLLAKKRSLLQKGGVPNTRQAAEIFLCDWTGAKLSYYCKPPETHSLPPYLSDTMVAEMQKAWDMGKLHQGNAAALKGIKCSSLASSITLTSSGPTSGLLNENEVCDLKDGGGELLQGDEVAEEDDEEEVPQLVPIEDKGQKKEKAKSVKVHPTKVTFSSLSVNIDMSSTQKDDDAYDFNVDFK